MLDSKHWPVRTWRRVYLTMLSAGTTALLIGGFASPDAWCWH
jgi:hypothetical protein